MRLLLGRDPITIPDEASIATWVQMLHQQISGHAVGLTSGPDPGFVNGWTPHRGVTSTTSTIEPAPKSVPISVRFW
jgi:hypothetical protein